jgi:MFS family permease
MREASIDRSSLRRGVAMSILVVGLLSLLLAFTPPIANVLSEGFSGHKIVGEDLLEKIQWAWVGSVLSVFSLAVLMVLEKRKDY